VSSHKKSEHHVIPRSRGGNRTCSIPETFHEAWHTIFQNLKPDEIETFITKLNCLMLTRNEISWEDINFLVNQVKED